MIGSISENTKSPSFATRLITIGLGLSVAAMGGFFCRYLWLDYQTARETDGWVETPCEILVSAIDDSGRNQHGGMKYQLEVRYRYEWEGRSRISDKVKRRRPIAKNDRRAIESWQRKYPAGSETICFVNPEAPGEAILKRDTKAALYSIWFPALFVAGGIGIAWAGIRRRSPS